jgi:hypothetical protein
LDAPPDRQAPLKDSSAYLQNLTRLCAALLGESGGARYWGATGGNHVVRRFGRNDHVAQDPSTISHIFICSCRGGYGSDSFVRVGLPDRHFAVVVR